MAGGGVVTYSCRVIFCAQLMLLLLLPEIKAGRCLQYSWLGTEFMPTLVGTEAPGKGTDAYRISNLTCREFPKPKPIPCVTPFLMTDDATTPKPGDVYSAFSRHSDPKYIQCDPGEGNVCALVTFFFGNDVVNQTAYCTRVTDDGTYMRNGCATSKKGAYTNRVCVCDPGSDVANQLCIPSQAQSIAAHKMVILLVSITVILLKGK